MRALVSGSFDPITLGHVDIIERAAKLYDDVRVVVMNNEEKTPLFTLSERTEMVRKSLASFKNVTVDSYDGFCYRYCLNNGIDVIVRGFRNAEDYEYETEMARYNKALSGVDTVLLQAGDGKSALSSTEARERIMSGSALNTLLPDGAIEFVLRKFGNTATEEET